MKKYTYGILITAIIGLIVSAGVSALSYQQDIGVSFTFNPVLRLTLSSADIYINELAPGTATDSNIITINVLTNTPNGYTLTASVGNDTTFSTAGRDLVHSNTNVTNKFSSIDFGSSVASNTNLADNTWGYSFSLDNGTNWINATKSDGVNNDTGYSGLPLYSDTTNIATLKSTTAPSTSSTGDNINFKIAAKASSDQVSGEYNNVINFNLVATPVPKTLEMAYADAGKEKHNGYFKMQDMSADICNSAEVLDEGSQMQVIDTRDNKVYWITKLRDGKCWMTQNLDHDIVAEAGYYTHDNTDLGWGSDTTTTSWTPVRATIDASNVTDNNIPNWANDSNTPYSVDPGNVYWNSTPFYTSTANLFLNNDWGSSPVKFQKDTPFTANGTHGHVGNYYNWSAAVASNDTSSYTASTYADVSANPQNSICPAGWRLPTISNQGNIEGSTSEFARLNSLYNNASTSSSQNLEAAPLYFVRAGIVFGSRQYYSGLYGYYWSSSVNSSNLSYSLYFYSSGVNPQNNYGRGSGFSLRCVSR